MNGKLNIAALMMIVFSICGCSFLSNDSANGRGNTNSATGKQAEVRNDIEALARTINLPVRPTEALWQIKTMGVENSRAPGPTDYQLTAVLKFDAANTAILLERLGESSAPKPTDNVEIAEWFPEEIKKAAQPNGTALKLKGTIYAPDSLLRPPYSSGTLIRVGTTNYFVLKAFTF